jgi:hypothetical protein
MSQLDRREGASGSWLRDAKDREVKFDEKAARYDEMLESEFGTQNEMLECEVRSELKTKQKVKCKVRCWAWWATWPEELKELDRKKLSSMMNEGLGIEDGGEGERQDGRGGIHRQLLDIGATASAEA